eukprot:g2511.t1
MDQSGLEVTVRESDVVHLIMHYLYQQGYHGALAELERESSLPCGALLRFEDDRHCGHSTEEDKIQSFENSVRNGEWEKILPQLSHLAITAPSSDDTNQHLSTSLLFAAVYEIVYLELLQIRDYPTASLLMKHAETNPLKYIKEHEPRRFIRMTQLLKQQATLQHAFANLLPLGSSEQPAPTMSGDTTTLDIRFMRQNRRNILAKLLGQLARRLNQGVQRNRLTSLIGDALKWQQYTGRLQQPLNTTTTSTKDAIYNLLTGKFATPMNPIEISTKQKSELSSTMNQKYTNLLEMSTRIPLETSVGVYKLFNRIKWTTPKNNSSPSHSLLVSKACFAPNGNWIATGSNDGLIEIYNPMSCKPKYGKVSDTTSAPIVMVSPGGKITALTVSHCSEMIACGTVAGVVTIFRASNGKCLREFHGERGNKSKGGRNPTSGTSGGTSGNGGSLAITSILFNKQSDKIYAGSHSGVVELLGLISGQILKTFSQSTATLTKAIVCLKLIDPMAGKGSSGQLVAGTSDGTIVIYDTQTTVIVQTLNSEGRSLLRLCQQAIQGSTEFVCVSGDGFGEGEGSSNDDGSAGKVLAVPENVDGPQPPPSQQVNKPRKTENKSGDVHGKLGMSHAGGPILAIETVETSTGRTFLIVLVQGGIGLYCSEEGYGTSFKEIDFLLLNRLSLVASRVSTTYRPSSFVDFFLRPSKNLIDENTQMWSSVIGVCGEDGWLHEFTVKISCKTGQMSNASNNKHRSMSKHFRSTDLLAKAKRRDRCSGMTHHPYYKMIGLLGGKSLRMYR